MATKKKAAPLKECPYGARCYRKNPDHFAEFSHPKKAKGDDSTDSPSTSAPKIKDDGLPPCKYGASCYRKNLLHFAEYSHPTAVTDQVTASDDSGHDTDVMSDEEDDKKASTSKKKKDVKSEDILKRGMSLVKTYSKMTEEERKELIKKAFEAKAKLQKELEETKEEMKKKEQLVEKLTKEVASGLLLMDGEKEAIEGKTTVYFDLFAERAYKEGSANQMHFRLAESQFYRLLSGSYASNYRISKVEYVVNPKLVKGFRECRDALKKLRGEEYSYPVLAFHGTKQEYITPICENGFKVPGTGGHKHRTDTGWYGKGVYFSEYPTYSMGYIQGATKLLLSQVLPGKVYNCTKLIHGAALQKGYDSHTSPDKKELVIFNTYHILPQYIVHYTTAAQGEFQYAEPAKAAKTKGGKATPSDDIDVQNMDPTLVNNKYWEAINKPATKVLKGYTVQFSGTFSGSQKEMQDLATKHGAIIGSKAVFNLLFAQPSEFNLKTNKVQQATKKGVDIVHEMFLYEAVVKKKLPDIDKYKFT